MKDFYIHFLKDMFTGLGISESVVYFILGFLSISIVYLLLKPIVRILVLLQWDKFLTFLLSSVFVLALTVSFLILTSESAFGHAAKVILGFCSFGFLLCSVQLFRLLLSTGKSSKQSVTQKV
ncbi:hypothetical protein KO561_08015 [Radiobacillus kanasensis]|uniref:hypothetical protein n=1 Tax=Radiobacillus kanasensis TaxID=2844358 RepID=UPI001E310C92|nr:hypothetical protein [Radiobacillus kanasensis]UFU00866.1 hypothetical protein KO561_08015 [Radiobacillus kanasensis]